MNKPGQRGTTDEETSALKRNQTWWPTEMETLKVI